MFEKIFIEKHLQDSPRAKRILAQFPGSQVHSIDRYDELFGKVRKPYLQKRQSLNLYLAEKKGKLIKEAPAAYGLGGDPHFYFIHSYNCIYECNYCYLQGYFDSPDLVFFLNHEEICQAISETAAQVPAGKTAWFHAGEFSDSLALSHLSGELPLLLQTFSGLTNAKLELRTKSANLKELLRLAPIDNVIVSFSLSPADKVKKNDLRTPSLSTRLLAMRKLFEHGYKIAVHLDPIIYDVNLEQSYIDLIEQLKQTLPAEKIEYLSLGVVRFTKDVYQQVAKNYPQSDLLSQQFVRTFDNKIRYNRPTRFFILNTVKKALLSAGFSEAQLYFCME
jgi:spore photoproduct lyase